LPAALEDGGEFEFFAAEEVGDEDCDVCLTSQSAWLDQEVIGLGHLRIKRWICK